MDWERKERDVATEGREHGDAYMHNFLYAAGAALTMACLKLVMVTFFMEQWRVRVFLFLNLVLLAILVSSTRSNASKIQESSNDEESMRTGKEKRRKQCDQSPKLKAGKEASIQCESTDEANEVKQEHSEAKSASLTLSQEELNERVEAFISMFRQHLISDAKLQGRSDCLSRSNQREILYSTKGVLNL